MTANLFHRRYTVAIGGKDFSPGVGLCQLTQDKQTSSGYVTTQGTLEILDWQGLDESLDPQTNLVRWRVGQSVDIRVADSAGVLQALPWGVLYIRSAMPSADYRSLELEIGDWLAIEEWRSTESPNEDVPEAGDMTVASYARQTLITELLTHVDMTPGDVVAGSWIGDRVEDLQGGFIDLCGGLAFGAESPGILWSQGKTARVTVIDPAPAAPWLQVTLGQDEALYEPQSAEFPVEIYTCTAESYGSATGEFEAGGPGCVVRSLLDETVDETATYCVDAASRTVSEFYLLDEPEIAINPDGGTGLVRSLERRTTKTYDAPDAVGGDRLVLVRSRVLRPRIAIFSEAAEEQGITLVDPWLDVTAELEETRYSYDDELGVVISIVWEREVALGQLAPKYVDPANWSTRTVAERRVERWERSPAGEWLYQKREYKSLILVNPQLVERREESGAYDMVAIASNLTAIPNGGLSGSTAGQTQPPGVEYFPESVDSENLQPETLEGQATFAPLPGSLRRSRETEEAIPLASSVAALRAAATIGGVFRLGRFWGRSLKLPIPDKFFESYEPLRRVDVVEQAAVKSFLGDGMVLLLDRTESSLFFPHLIWLGTAAAQGITGVSGNALAVPDGAQFEIGQTVQFAPVPEGGLPSGLEPGITYHVVGTAGGLQVSASPGGSPISIGTLPPVAASVVLPSPDPVTGALGDPAPAYGGAPFVVIPTSANSDPRVPRPISPPYQVTVPGFAELLAGIIVGQALPVRKSRAIAPVGVQVGQSLEARKGGSTATNGVVIGQFMSARKSRAIASSGVLVGMSIRAGAPGLADGGAIAGELLATRTSWAIARDGVVVGEGVSTRKSGAIAPGGVLIGGSLATRPSGFGVAGGVLLGQEMVGRSPGVSDGAILFMAHARGLPLTAADARRVGARSRSLVQAISVLGKA